MLQRERHAAAREPIARAVRPLHEHERARAEDLVPRERVELLRAVEAVEVEMVDRRSGRLVLLHQREGRAGHLAGDAVPLADRLNERRLPCAELTGERDEQWGMRRAAESMAPITQLGFVHRERAMV